jgi:hypothetical protein
MGITYKEYPRNHILMRILKHLHLSIQIEATKQKKAVICATIPSATFGDTLTRCMSKQLYQTLYCILARKIRGQLFQRSFRSAFQSVTSQEVSHSRDAEDSKSSGISRRVLGEYFSTFRSIVVT